MAGKETGKKECLAPAPAPFGARAAQQNAKRKDMQTRHSRLIVLALAAVLAILLTRCSGPAPTHSASAPVQSTDGWENLIAPENGAPAALNRERFAYMVQAVQNNDTDGLQATAVLLKAETKLDCKTTDAVTVCNVESGSLIGQMVYTVRAWLVTPAVWNEQEQAKQAATERELCKYGYTKYCKPEERQQRTARAAREKAEQAKRDAEEARENAVKEEQQRKARCEVFHKLYPTEPISAGCKEK